ncbi:MAG: RNA-directed DNA polymerase [Eubacteriales bacterium]|nr:RNA-directed DNA polymerase [Eubacteriales bacterium]
MRSYNNLYEPMLQDEYIQKCFRDAAKKKRKRNDVQRILDNIDTEVGILKQILQEEMFLPSYHEKCIINENNYLKTRRILKPSYKYEQVVHHCAIGQFKPIVMNGLYEFSCGSVPKRGVHYGKKFMKKWIESYNGKKMYILKMDIHHFFESIDRTILKKKLQEAIRDRRFYRLMCVFVEYDRIAETVKILEDVATEMSIDGVRCLVSCIAFDDDMEALEILRGAGVAGETFIAVRDVIYSRRKGVPLGYFTSQWFGNFYLKKLDHYIKQELSAEHYMRYMDDMVILGKSKKKLHKIRTVIKGYLQDELKLELKGDWQVFRFEYEGKDGKVYGRMLDFMGFQFHHDRITMRKSTIQRARAKAMRIAAKEKVTWYDAATMLSYMGWFNHTDTYDYYQRYIKPNVNVKKLKKIVSNHQRKENERERMAQSNGNAAGETGGDRQNILAVNRVSA